MRKYFLLLTLLAVALNAAGIFYHKPMLNIIAIGLILILIPLDIYLEPTRRQGDKLLHRRGIAGSAVGGPAFRMDHSVNVHLSSLLCKPLGQLLEPGELC
ncbi:hypothetical protein C173_04021 [Paenibacillus sp. FSL R7-277]|uniref:hypothetical protein n=1 Tax=Paenibacillus sp. FSL R7-277 TaxID=1227352 RepID=UPI0003E2550B|nr:hypothetical protein [Paenibacillus sp. FSL R7-277]ETT76974.1 hypothetical protein C173_04021 [Paenibacillus sp. FSL R7-277]